MGDRMLILKPSDLTALMAIIDDIRFKDANRLINFLNTCIESNKPIPVEPPKPAAEGLPS